MIETTPAARARAALAGTRFTDVRWVASTGSTNADVLALARDGEREGVVLVADHQRAGRGRLGRTWTAPPGGSLLVTVLLRPPAALVGGTTMAVAVAAAEAVERCAGIAARLKWPNDLVWPGDGRGQDRKLAGILAELDWPAGSAAASGWERTGARVAVVVGMGLNVSWPGERPAELAEVAITAEEVAGRPVDRVELLIAYLQRLDVRYGQLLSVGGPADVRHAWRARSATLGRRVRVDLGADDVVGTAVDVTDEGHLVVAADDGTRRVLAVGDVVHLRPLTDEPEAGSAPDR